MTTVLIIVCILACVAVIVGIVAHLGIGIRSDQVHRERLRRHYFSRARRRRADQIGR